MERSMMADEKLKLLNGKDFWTSYSDECFDIDEIVFADGPTGLRYQGGEADHLGMNDSSEATCFPTSSAMACTWNTKLMEEVSSCIAREAIEKGVDVVLGPGVNIKRDPLCGRNFEYYSEDPYLTAEMGTAFVNGLQKNGIGASLKHFACNNQEKFRMSINVSADDRALYEIYLKAFEYIIAKSKPWTVMTAYNKLNGSYCSENIWLLNNVLRERFKYDGLVLSDWYAVNDIVSSVNNGLDLEMPSVGDLSFKVLKDAYENGKLNKERIDKAANNIRTLSGKCRSDLKKLTGKVDLKDHHEIARKAAEEAIVLLKNKRSSLPLKRQDKLLFVGELMNHPVIQGNGSSRVNASMVDTIPEELSKNQVKYTFEPGYILNDNDINEELIHNAVESSKNADKVIIFAGLFNYMEAESYDRENLNLPVCQERLIEAIAESGKELIVILQTGSAVVMPWIEKTDSVLQMHLAGQGAGKAIADILLGKVNPSGRLTETYPKMLSHCPSYLFRGSSTEVRYNESIFVGYRYYDKKMMDVEFPFGHGLSYSEFEYDNFKIMNSDNDIQISFTIKNKGQYPGKEVSQVYVGLNEDRDIQPVRKLAAFEKVFLIPGEEKEMLIKLSIDDFMYYDTDQGECVYANGFNTVEVGKSSREILFSEKVEIKNSNKKYNRISTNTTIGEIQGIPEIKDVVEGQISILLDQTGVSSDGAVNAREFEESMYFTPLRNIVQVTNGEFSYDSLYEFIKYLNGILEGMGVLND